MKNTGAWYPSEGEQLGQGRENAKTFLVETPEVMVDISERILAEVGIGQVDEDAPIDLVPDPDDVPISLD